MELINTLLLEAIQGESDAEMKYLVFSARAEAEGYPGVGRLFTGLAQAESIHIANHRRALEKNGYSGDYPRGSGVETCGDTLENAKESLAGELEEYTRMYPTFKRRISKAHGREFVAKIALLSITWAADSEKNHHDLLKRAISALEQGKDMDSGDFYLCRVCGNLHFSAGIPAEQCPVCGHDLHFYSKIEVAP